MPLKKCTTKYSSVYLRSSRCKKITLQEEGQARKLVKLELFLNIAGARAELEVLPRLFHKSNDWKKGTELVYYSTFWHIP